MNGAFVVDCSVSVGWVLPGQADAFTSGLLLDAKNRAAVHVPDLWHLETANALVVAVRRKLLTEVQRKSALAMLAGLNLISDHETANLAFSAISDFAVKHMLTVYDASYLELARRLSLPLGTRDEALKTAAKKCGVKLLQ